MLFSPQAIIYQVNSPDMTVSIMNWLTTTFPQLKPSEINFINQTKESITIETVRNLNQEIQYGLAEHESRVCVLLHAELLTLPAQNALLKTLEEPPEQTLLVLASESPMSLLKTIHSRCQLIVEESLKHQVDTASAEKLVNLIENGTVGYLTQLSDQYPKKEAAIVIVKELINFYFQRYALISKDNSNADKSILQLTKVSKYISISQYSLNLLQKNVQVKLVLDDLFYKLHATAVSNKL